jgi:putative ABC transport system permease protein
MKFKDLLIKANRYVLRSRTRSILTILSIVVGSTTLTLALGLGFGVQQVFNRQLNTTEVSDTLRIFPGVSEEQAQMQSSSPIPEYTEQQEAEAPARENPITENVISEEDITSLREIDGVEDVLPEYIYEIEYITIAGDDTRYVPTITVFYDRQEYELLAGNEPTAADQVVVDEVFLEVLETESADSLVGEDLTVSYFDNDRELQSRQFEISGVKATGVTEQAGVAIDYEILAAIHQQQFSEDDLEYELASSAIVLLEEGLSADKVEEIKQDIRDKNLVIFDLALLAGIAQQVAVYLTIGLVAFAGIIIFASLFGVTNTMLMSVFERTKEIGLMKALGLSNRSVFSLFALEGAIIGLWGGVIGVALGTISGSFLLNPLFNYYFSEQGVDEPFQLVFPVLWLIVVLISLMFICFLAAVLPSRRAAGLDPIEALRYE